MEDKVIIYLALCNQVQSYQLLLQEESKNLSDEDRGMIEYIISRSLEIIDKLTSELNNGGTAIKRPKWDNL